MPGRPIDCFPWDCSGGRSFSRATSRGPNSNGRPQYKSEPPAMLVGSFKVWKDGKARITISPGNYFYLPMTADVRSALKGSGKATKANSTSNYGVGLVEWKKGKKDAKVTWYSPFTDPKNLAKLLSKQEAQAIYDRWLK